MKKIIIAFTVIALASILIAEQAISKSVRSSDRGWLGITTQSVDYDLSEGSNLNIKYGAIIDDVFDDSPAEKAGLKEDDVIIALNGEKITDSEDLIDLLIDTNKGDKVELTIIRNNNEKTVTVTLGEKPQSHKSLKTKIFHDKDDMVFLGHDTRGYIGVNLIDLTEQLGDYFGVKDSKGALVISVEEDSPAEKAGLKAGDVIVELDGDDISDSDDIREIIGDMEEGDLVAIKIVRDKKKTEFELTVAEKDSYGYQYFSGPDVNIVIPLHSGRFYHHGNYDWDDFDFDFDFDAIEDIDELEELEEFDDLSDHFKRVEIDFKRDSEDVDQNVVRRVRVDKNEFRDEVKKLREELKKMKKELRQELDEIHDQLD